MAEGLSGDDIHMTSFSLRSDFSYIMFHSGSVQK